SDTFNLQDCLQNLVRLSKRFHLGLSKYQTMLITASLVLMWWFSTRVKKDSPDTLEDTSQ
ncbi:hypothetical protein M9458_008337, partial [Cirrhinus mrigala]